MGPQPCRSHPQALVAKGTKTRDTKPLPPTSVDESYIKLTFLRLHDIFLLVTRIYDSLALWRMANAMLRHARDMALQDRLI